MKLSVNKNQLSEAPEMFLRRAGYTFLSNREGNQDSFVRRLSRDFYPRFHIYFTIEKDPAGNEIVVFALHLDQKQPGYAGVNRHNAEYDGEPVEAEGRRIQSLVLPAFFAR